MPLNTVLIEDSETIRENLIPTLAELANAHVIAVAQGASEAIEVLDRHKQEWDLPDKSTELEAFFDLCSSYGAYPGTIFQPCSGDFV